MPDLPPDAARAIVARADGIPLYAVETVRMLVAEGKLRVGHEDGMVRPTGPLGDIAIPDTLRSLIASRLDALAPPERGLLQFASVLGQSFTVESVAAVTGADKESLVARLRAFVRQDLLTVQADPRSPERGQYGFVQGLIREVAYGTLARRERRERHLAAARYYETLADEEVAGALATHYLAAHGASDEGPEADAVAVQARLALRGAAERASALGAPEQAAGHLQRAIDVTREPLERAELFERAAAAANAAGLYDEAERHARAAGEVYAQLEQPVAAARVAGRLGMILIDAGRMSEAADVLAHAIDGLGDSAPEHTAELESGLARVYMRINRLPDAIAAADRALVIAEPRKLLRVVAEALASKGSALGFLGRSREAAALIAAAVRIAEQAGAPTTQLRALNNLAVVIVEEEPDQGTRLFEEALELARRLGERGYVNFLTPNLAFQYFLAGRDWELAQAMLAERYEAAGSDSDKARQLNAMLPFSVFRGEAASDDIDRLEALLAGTDDPVTKASVEVHRCQLALVEGRLAEAHEFGLRATAIYPSHYGGIVNGIHAALWAGDLGRARELHAFMPGMLRGGPIVEAFKSGAEAGIAALEGRTEEAIAGFIASLDAWSALNLNLPYAIAAIDALSVLPGELKLVPFAERARAILERVGAKPLLERLDEELRSVALSAALTD